MLTAASLGAGLSEKAGSPQTAGPARGLGATSRRQALSTMCRKASQITLCRLARGSGTSHELQYPHAHWIKSRQTGSQSKH